MKLTRALNHTIHGRSQRQCLAAAFEGVLKNRIGRSVEPFILRVCCRAFPH